MPLRYQSVLNYAQGVTFYCHAFNLRRKAPLGDTAAGDETYIRVAGQHPYPFFFLDPHRPPITSNDVASAPDALAATVALTALFVTHYNFLRAHAALHYRVPVAVPELNSITTLQGQ